MQKVLLVFILFPIISFGQTTIDYRTNVDFTNMKFINEKEGWVVGGCVKKKCLIFKTTDGGTSWIDISISDSTLLKIEAVEFVTRKTGFVVGGPGFIFRTDDGGVNWKRVYRNTEPQINSGWFHGITFITENLGFTYGRYGVFLVSADSGETWRRLKLNTIDMAFGQMTVNTSPYYICSSSGINRIEYFPDKDSLSIKYVHSSRKETRSMQFFDSKNGWTVGEGCQVLRFENGLVKAVDVPKKADYVYLNSLYFCNMSEGWICGNRGKIFYTRNKGKYWKIVEGFPDAPLRKITFVNDTTGFICGLDFVYRTTDRGKSWLLVLSDKGMQNQLPSKIISNIEI
jgi:photosystem II stability/assembly factor-like uncharacterized protein